MQCENYDLRQRNYLLNIIVTTEMYKIKQMNDYETLNVENNDFQQINFLYVLSATEN